MTGKPIGAVQGLAPDRIVALGTVSKSLAPAVRLGWVLCTPALAEAVGDEKGRSDRGSPVIDQLAVAALIESGRYDRHLRRMRATYANPRRALAEALASHAPAINLTERAIHNGIAAVSDLLQGQATHSAERMPSA
jgi:GntR family transcriptional regulator / MocR family aminotransferase